MRSASRGLAVLTALLGLAVAAQAASIDTTTQGNWVGVYGKDGYILNAYNGGGGGSYYDTASPVIDLSSLPSYVSGYSYNNAQQYVWSNNETPPGQYGKYNSVLEPPGVTNPYTGPRTAATTFTGDTMDVIINLNQPKTFQLGVYGLDWDNYNGRDMIVTVNGQNPIEYSTANGYTTGEWGLWTVTGGPNNPIDIQIQQLAGGGSNSTISGITFDSQSSPVPEPASLTLLGLGSLGLLCWRGRKRVLA